jgi:CheY-like chemotaxis protein
VPICAITANAVTGDRERCRRVGMNDDLAKPVSAEALRAILATWA